MLACTLLLAACGSAPVEEVPAAPEVSQEQLEAEALAKAVETRGEPCDCVVENMEAMSALLESLKSTERMTAQELNIQIATMLLPCMKPEGDTMQDRAFSKAMGKCEGFAGLTEVMTQVKNEVQARVQEEAANDASRDLGAEGAKDVLNKLKQN